MIDLEAIAKDAAERIHKNGGCVPQLAFAPILFALQDALSTTPARAEAQDEGAAGEFETAEAMAEAWSDRVEIQRMVETTSAVFAKWASPEILSRFRQQMMAVIQQAYIEGVSARVEALAAAHPSPTPAADAEALLPEVMTEEMERVWRGAFIHQGHKRHGRGAIGNSRRLKNPESCEQYAWRALRKHLLAALKSTAAKEGGEP